jgi:hypothetical protein
MASQEKAPEAKAAMQQQKSVTNAQAQGELRPALE